MAHICRNDNGQADSGRSSHHLPMIFHVHGCVCLRSASSGLHKLYHMKAQFHRRPLWHTACTDLCGLYHSRKLQSYSSLPWSTPFLVFQGQKTPSGRRTYCPFAVMGHLMNVWDHHLFNLAMTLCPVFFVPLNFCSSASVTPINRCSRNSASRNLPTLPTKLTCIM